MSVGGGVIIATPTLNMKITRLAVLALLVGCAERAPVEPPTQDLIGFLPDAVSLMKCSPLPADSVTETVGPDGGVLRVGPHSLVIPPGALDQPVEITALAPTDTVNRVHFEPHGLEFDRPVYVTLSYANCRGVGTFLPKQVAYTTDALEILELLASFDNLFLRRVTGRTTHFSDYAVAW